MNKTQSLVLNTLPYILYFTRINLASSIKYFVFAEDSKGANYAFNMESDGNNWRIINAPKVPDIFIDNEHQLALYIDKMND